MVAVHLARLSPNLRLLLIDRNTAFGCGAAYGAGDAQHLLNVPAGKISAFAEEPDHFLQWLEGHRAELPNLGVEEISRESFLPRQVYGKYVRDILDHARRTAPGLDMAETEVVDIEPGRKGLALIGKNGEMFAASKVVLALGNFPPGDPPTKDRRFHRSARYFNLPWSPTMLPQISGEDDILILGSGLTTLDLLVSLDVSKARGKIYVVSRHGLFPQPHQSYAPQPEWFQDRELPSTVRPMLRLLRDEVEKAAAQGIDWRAILDALRPHTQRIWRSFNIEERSRFMRHARPFWESHRHRVAPSVLAVKENLAQRGQLILRKARVLSIIESEGGFDVTLFDRARMDESRLRVGFVVNSTGPECNFYKLKDPLVVNLLARGLVHPDPLFLGLMTAVNGAVLNYLGQPSTAIFTLGSVKKGMLFETTSVPELRQQARTLAEELLGSSESLVPRPPERKRGAAAGQLVLISNRGPNDFVWQDERWVPRPASGGLVSMVGPLARQPDVTWFCCVSEPLSANEARSALYTTAADQTDPAHHIVPVPLPARVYQAYYGAISNEVLWMLQHHLAGQFGYSSLDAARHHAWNDGYLEANRRMVVAIRASGIKPRAFLIQDYHFYPLPALLRKVFPDTPSLHFTHIPFPDAATLKLIPQQWRETILRGLLGADVVAMQTVWDARPFLGCCEELLGAKVDYERGIVLEPDGRVVRVCAFAASTDPVEVRQTLESPEVASARKRLAPYLDKLTVIRVDRIDPSKNQIIGFRAFGRLLEMRPDLRGNVRFLAFLVPSRTDLSVYRDYRNAVYEAIEEINRRFAPQCGFQPIEVFYTNDRQQALAAMQQCDVLLANSREDGMNLVVKEWVVASERPGVAIISETAGVAAEMGASALLVSPLDIEGTAHAMAWALDMPAVEREARLARLREKVNSWTSADWLSAQMDALNLAKKS
jgi:trehalose-6-phosphate synthase